MPDEADEPGPAPGSGPGAGPAPGPELGPVLERPRRRWFPASVGGVLYLAVVVATAVGLLVVATGEWRAGVRWIGSALLAAAAARAFLRGRAAGMLAVRGAVFDTVLLVAVGLALWFLAGSIPDQPA